MAKLNQGVNWLNAYYKYVKNVQSLLNQQNVCNHNSLAIVYLKAPINKLNKHIMTK